MYCQPHKGRCSKVQPPQRWSGNIIKKLEINEKNLHKIDHQEIKKRGLYLILDQESLNKKNCI